ncbi:PadR family transcriptional regulator [archaeon]|mgnify:CR=1 FL=1|jgi:PadR family transcriptional regulator, regulatory protein PadR|nr:PadR family transcriptional regulator [archaeon]MBT4351578.1 PadR family transcriptional regulator [archaeon]MBT4648604.1 PadR family transcriptional regulator [archaeon]MBT6821433.1 PadR family transcriptional regulator [archaeon]MBT7393028.1 PadR family transcriptional regulator [archaeon]
MDTQFKKGVLDICVLSLLKKKDHYGYEIVRKISKDISISEGTIYPLLRRLKKDGHVGTYLKESNEGPSRKYYSLTKEGEIRAGKLKKEWIDFEKKINKILK